MMCKDVMVLKLSCPSQNSHIQVKKKFHTDYLDLRFVLSL